MPQRKTRMVSASSIVLVTAAACGAGMAHAAQAASRAGVQGPIEPRAVRHKTEPRASLRMEVRMVLIPVTVTDPFGTPVAGLSRDAFRLYEDGVEQRVKYFASEDAPVSLGIIFDTSRSMEGKLDKSRQAITELFNTAIPGDEFFLVEFNDSPRLLCDFTTDTEWIEKSLVGIQPRNWTALFDAVYLGVHRMKAARNSRKLLVVVSDGGDNNSRYTEAEMRRFVREADVCIYSIGIACGLMNRHVRLLRKLAEETGGRLYEVKDPDDLAEAAGKINLAIRNQYLLGYSSDNPSSNGLYRKVEVRLEQPATLPRLRVSWRTGYYAPLQ